MKSVFDQMNLRPLERRLVVAGLIVIFVVINAWWVWPQFKQWDTVKSDTARFNQTLSQFKTEVAKLPALVAKENELKGSDDSMVQADAGSMGVILMKAAQTKARVTGVNFSGYQPGAAHKVDQYFEEQTLSTPFNNTGDTNLLDFLISVGEEGMVRVRDLNLKPDTGQTRLSGSVTLAATYQSQSALPVRGQAPPPPPKRP
jgi:Tfp pilus assembly protein PilO